VISNPTVVADSRATIRELVMIGAGTLGRQLAERAALAGFATVLQDLLPSSRERAMAAIRADLERAGINPEDVLGRIRLAGSLDDALAAADLVIGTTPDELESKQEMFTLLDRMAPRNAILVAVTMLPLAMFCDVTCREASCIAVRVDLDDMQAIVTAHPANPATLVASVLDVFRMLGFTAKLEA